MAKRKITYPIRKVECDQDDCDEQAYVGGYIGETKPPFRHPCRAHYFKELKELK